MDNYLAEIVILLALVVLVLVLRYSLWPVKSAFCTQGLRRRAR